MEKELKRRINKMMNELQAMKELIDSDALQEKQKEQEHICDSAQYEEGFKTGLEIGLRKQKENPKSTDFIPSDCVSDAKCEDRWHKVEDSLPDNGREVLAKDKLGNTLLARYDGEGWDVSVYDDEDYRCHNGISKWCEIPFEKQKEQKPAEWSEDSVKFEEGFKAGRESGLRDGQKYVLNNLDSYGLCKLAEWSEEDKLPRYYGD